MYDSTHPLLLNLHAEDIVITEIVKKWQYIYNINDLQILIWKQNILGEIRPVYSCQWCKKRIIKSGFPIQNVITINQYYMLNHYIYYHPALFDVPEIPIIFTKSNIIECAVTEYIHRYPLLRIQNSRHPMKRRNSKKH